MAIAIDNSILIVYLAGIFLNRPRHPKRGTWGGENEIATTWLVGEVCRAPLKCEISKKKPHRI